MSTVLVTGGTGTLGREVVRALAAAGHVPRIGSRRPAPGDLPTDRQWATVDYRSGAGLADAAAGVDAVVLATGASREAPLIESVIKLSDPATHLVFISIVGVDRVPIFYYRNKIAAERVLIDSGREWTILRATQFHTLALSMMRALAAPPVMLIPRGARMQPVSPIEVGRRLADLAVAPPAGQVADLGGPEVLTADDLARQYSQSTGKRRRVVRVPIPGRVMRAVADGGLTCPEHRDGRQTFREFLAARAAA